MNKGIPFRDAYKLVGEIVAYGVENDKVLEDLTIEELIERTKKDVTEVVLALNPTMEGETTSYYIAKKLQDIVEVSVLAQGLPMGGHLEYVDEMTLTRSLKNRKKFDY